MKIYNYGYYPPPVLPGMEEYAHITTDVPPHNPSPLVFTPSPARIDPFTLKICECCNFTSKWQMPIVNGVTDPNILKYEIMGYDRLSNRKSKMYGTHFYCADNKIMSSVRAAMRVYDRIKEQPFVIGPDYSIKMNMLLPQKLLNSFDNKLITAWYQYMGMTAIANVVWADIENIEAYLEGYPPKSIIAINSTGIGRDARAIDNWISGYRYVIEVLDPIAIIRYGVKMKGEIESISYYKENDNLKSCKYGW